MNKLFYFIIIDRTRKIFSISEPTWNDQGLVNRVCELKDKYSMTAYHAPVIDGKRDEIIRFHQEDGFELVGMDLILEF